MPFFVPGRFPLTISLYQLCVVCAQFSENGCVHIYAVILISATPLLSNMCNDHDQQPLVKMFLSSAATLKQSTAALARLHPLWATAFNVQPDVLQVRPRPRPASNSSFKSPRGFITLFTYLYTSVQKCRSAQFMLESAILSRVPWLNWCIVLFSLSFLLSLPFL